MNWQHGNYIITDDKSRIDIEAVFNLLSHTYWAKGRSRETIVTTVANSICFAVLYDNMQVGFARVVTDRAVFAWIADVIVDERHRGKGLGKKLIACIQAHPDIPQSRQLLRTKDAHGLYEAFGFKTTECMTK